MTLVRVVSHRFVAGLILDERGICVRAAPILARLIGFSIAELRDHFAANRWQASVLP